VKSAQLSSFKPMLEEWDANKKPTEPLSRGINSQRTRAFPWEQVKLTWQCRQLQRPKDQCCGRVGPPRNWEAGVGGTPLIGGWGLCQARPNKSTQILTTSSPRNYCKSDVSTHNAKAPIQVNENGFLGHCGSPFSPLPKWTNLCKQAALDALQHRGNRTWPITSVPRPPKFASLAGVNWPHPNPALGPSMEWPPSTSPAATITLFHSSLAAVSGTPQINCPPIHAVVVQWYFMRGLVLDQPKLPFPQRMPT